MNEIIGTLSVDEKGNVGYITKHNNGIYFGIMLDGTPWISPYPRVLIKHPGLDLYLRLREKYEARGYGTIWQ